MNEINYLHNTYLFSMLTHLIIVLLRCKLKKGLF